MTEVAPPLELAWDAIVKFGQTLPEYNKTKSDWSQFQTPVGDRRRVKTDPQEGSANTTAPSQPNVDMSTARIQPPAAAPGSSTAPTSSVGSPTPAPAAANTKPGTGVGAGSTGATCGGCQGPTPCGNTACAMGPKSLFGLNNQQGSGQVGVQSSATNQNPPGVPEQRGLAQRIDDLGDTLSKPHTEGMTGTQKIGASIGQVANNMRGGDGNLQTGLGLNIMPQSRYQQPVASWWPTSKPAAGDGWWESGGATAAA